MDDIGRCQTFVASGRSLPNLLLLCPRSGAAHDPPHVRHESIFVIAPGFGLVSAAHELQDLRSDDIGRCRNPGHRLADRCHHPRQFGVREMSRLVRFSLLATPIEPLP